MFNLKAACENLRRCRTTSQIKDFRAGLTKEQAQAVIRALEPVERGAVLLAMHFGGMDGRGAWAGMAEAHIVTPTLTANDDETDG